jgi:hypothetical protein
MRRLIMEEQNMTGVEALRGPKMQENLRLPKWSNMTSSREADLRQSQQGHIRGSLEARPHARAGERENPRIQACERGNIIMIGSLIDRGREAIACIILLKQGGSL